MKYVAAPVTDTAPRYLLLLLTVGLVAVVVCRFFFFGKGAYFFPDEFRYNGSLSAAKMLLQGDFRGFCASLASTDGRPGDAALRLVPALLQRLWLADGGPNVLTPESVRIPILFNYAVVLASAGIFYRMCRLLLPDRTLALLTSLLYACLTNTNIYLRHLVPYDAALLLLLVLVYYVLRHKRKGADFSVGQYAAIGFLSALLVTIYPGYYMAPFIVLAVLADWLHPIHFLQTRWKSVLAYAVGGLLVIGLFEAITRIGSASYIRRSYDLAHTIDQGSPEESFTFLFKYLFQVEGPLGYGLAAALLLYSLLVLRNVLTRRWRYTGEMTDVHRLLLVAGLFFLLHAAVGYFLHRLVFYGRLLHPFMPFLVLAVGMLLSHVERPVLRTSLVLGLAGLALVSFGRFFYEYRTVQYPVDIMADFHLDQNDQGRVQRGYQVVTALPLRYSLPEAGPISNEAAALATQPVGLLNFVYPFPLQLANTPVVPASLGSRVVFDSPHAINFRAYPFEGYSIAERLLLPTIDLRMQIRTGESL